MVSMVASVLRMVLVLFQIRNYSTWVTTLWGFWRNSQLPASMENSFHPLLLPFSWLWACVCVWWHLKNLCKFLIYKPETNEVFSEFQIKASLTGAFPIPFFPLEYTFYSLSLNPRRVLKLARILMSKQTFLI